MAAFRRWIPNHPWQIVAALVWLSLGLGANQYLRTHDMSVLDLFATLQAWLTLPMWGIALYISLYWIRPLVFVPGTVMTLLAGYLYGVWIGLAAALVGGLLAATIPYALGRWFTDEARLAASLAEQDNVLSHLLEGMREHPFQSVLMARFMFLPYDVANFVAGELQIAFVPFLLATAIGNSVNAFVIVSVGASIEGDFAMRTFSLEPANIAVALAVWVVSFGLMRFWRSKQTLTSKMQNIEGDRI